MTSISAVSLALDVAGGEARMLSLFAHGEFELPALEVVISVVLVD